MKKLNWKVRWLLLILCAVLLIILLLFGSTYYYFVEKLSRTNEQITDMNFEESEDTLKEILDNASYYLTKFSNNELAWEFEENDFTKNSEKTTVIQKIVKSFDEMLSSDSNIYGIAILTGSGRTVLSTREKKSRSGTVTISEKMQECLADTSASYPYVSWMSGDELGIPSDSELYLLANTSVLLGIKSLGEIQNWDADSYLIVTLQESLIRQNYQTVSYNGSRAVLVDAAGQILSSTDSSLIGQDYEPDPEDQNIEYSLSYYNWKLVNMIPKKEYLQEIRDIRNVALALGFAAGLLVVVFCFIWNRRYTRPIQILMNQMEMVEKENLDIASPKKAGWPELDGLNMQFYETVQKLKSYIRRLQEAEQAKAREELLALQYQINPHFLYNSLNSIRWMAVMTNNQSVADSLVTLCRIITPVLRNPDFVWKLEDELDFLDNYVKMMQLRYVNEMDYSLECPKEILSEKFPRFILQPVIENCFVHGSSPQEHRHIYVRIRRKERFAVEIQNTGVYLTPEELEALNDKIQSGKREGNGIGLSNVQTRLGLLYGEEGKIWAESSPERGLLTYIRF